MNAEAKALSAVLKDKQIHVLLQANPDLLFVSHKDVWEFIKDYATANGVVPPTELVVDSFRDFDPSKDVGSTKHHLGELQEEYMDRSVREILRKAAGQVQDGAIVNAVDELISGASDLKKTSSAVKDIDLVDADSAIDHFKSIQELNSMGGAGIRTGLHGFDASMPSGISGGQLGIFLAYPGIGKPTTLDTPVATPGGWVKKGDLSVGDDVISASGNPTSVVGIQDQGELDAYRVTLSDETSVVVGPDHDWTVYTRNTYYTTKKTFVKTTLELKDDLSYDTDSASGEVYKYIIPLIDPVKYDEKDLPVDPYTLGVFLASVGDETDNIVISDLDVADLISERNPGMSVNGALELEFDDNRVPTEYLFASVEQRYELLRGLLDVGGFSKKNSRINFSSPNKNLVDDLAELVRSLGGTAKVSSIDNDYSIDMRIDKPFNLESKSERYVHRVWARSIKSIERVGRAKMRCISVADPEHLYAVNDYILTHNSFLALYFAVQAWKQGKTPLVLSLEMSESEVRNRLYALLGEGIWSLQKLSRGEVELDTFKKWHKKVFEGMPPFYIVSTDGLGEVNTSVVRSKIDQYKPDFVVFDYMQLATPDQKSDNETVKMKNLSREFKLLAMTTQTPILAISSATPNDVTNLSEPPTLGQTAWSRQIAFDADWLLALGREPMGDVVTMTMRKNRAGHLSESYVQVDFDAGRFVYTDAPGM